MGMGFEYWEVGFGKKLAWEIGLVPPLQDPHYGISLSEKREQCLMKTKFVFEERYFSPNWWGI